MKEEEAGRGGAARWAGLGAREGVNGGARRLPIGSGRQGEAEIHGDDAGEAGRRAGEGTALGKRGWRIPVRRGQIRWIPAGFG